MNPNLILDIIIAEKKLACQKGIKKQITFIWGKTLSEGFEALVAVSCNYRLVWRKPFLYMGTNQKRDMRKTGYSIKFK